MVIAGGISGRVGAMLVLHGIFYSSGGCTPRLAQSLARSPGSLSEHSFESLCGSLSSQSRCLANFLALRVCCLRVGLRLDLRGSLGVC